MLLFFNSNDNDGIHIFETKQNMNLLCDAGKSKRDNPKN